MYAIMSLDKRREITVTKRTVTERMNIILTAQGHFQAGLTLLRESEAVDAERIEAMSADCVAVLERELEEIFNSLSPAARRLLAAGHA